MRTPRALAVIRKRGKAPFVYLPEGAFGLQDPADVGIDNIAGEWLSIRIAPSAITATPWPTDPRANPTMTDIGTVYRWPDRGNRLTLADAA